MKMKQEGKKTREDILSGKLASLTTSFKKLEYLLNEKNCAIVALKAENEDLRQDNEALRDMQLELERKLENANIYRDYLANRLDELKLAIRNERDEVERQQEYSHWLANRTLWQRIRNVLETERL